jgi:von Willebrand factor type A domain
LSAIGRSIPLGDAPTLLPRATAARRLRLALVVAVTLLVSVGLAATLRARTGTATVLPTTSGGIVVLDVSASISSDTFARINATLERLIRSNGRYGLVLFSDTAYLALPPATPARELRSFARFFAVPGRQGGGALPELPRSPWTDSFSGGTRISTGLEVARDVIRTQRLVDPAVLLVSDLDDDTGDLDRVSQLAVAYRRAGIPLHVIGLDPAPEDVAFIRRLLPDKRAFTRAALPGEGSSRAFGEVDRTLVIVTILVALCLALLAVVSSTLRWRAA